MNKQENSSRHQNLLHHKEIELVFTSNLDASSGNTQVEGCVWAYLSYCLVRNVGPYWRSTDQTELELDTEE